MTSDTEIAEIADKEGRTVITKDEDFVESYFLRGKPKSIMIITTGNIKNSDLLLLVKNGLDQICESLETSSYLELAHDTLIIHD